MSPSRSGLFRKTLVSIASAAVVIAGTLTATSIGGTVIAGSPEPAVTAATATQQVTPASKPADSTAPNQVAQLVAHMQPAVVTKLEAVTPDEARALPASVVPVTAVKAASSVVTKYCSRYNKPVVDGPGYRITTGWQLRKFATVHVGAYIDCKQGKLIYCIQSLRILTVSQKMKFTENLRSKGSTVTQEVAYVVNHWGQTSSNLQSAVASVALKKIFKDTPFTKDYKGTYLPELKTASKNKNFNSLVDRYIATAKAYRGPVKLVVIVTKKPAYTGQSGAATVKLVSTKTGKAWPDHAVSLRASGAAVATSKSSRLTNTKGVATFTFRATKPGTITLTASTSHKSAVKVLVTVPSKTQQTLVSPVTTALKAAAKTSWGVKGPKAPKVTSKCDTTCNGAAPVTIAPPCNVKGAATLQYRVYVNGKYTKALNLASGKCGKTTLTVKDRSKVTTAYRYYVNGKWTAVKKFPGTFTVDCPPLPGVKGHVSLNIHTVAVKTTNTTIVQTTVNTDVATTTTDENKSWNMSCDCSGKSKTTTSDKQGAGKTSNAPTQSKTTSTSSSKSSTQTTVTPTAKLTITGSKNVSHAKQVVFITAYNAKHNGAGTRLITKTWAPGKTLSFTMTLKQGQRFSVYAGTYRLNGSLKWQYYFSSPSPSQLAVPKQ